MKFILLFIKKNFQYRKANYILPFISFVLSGILLCTSVFYLTLAKNDVVFLPSSPYDITIKSDNEQEYSHISETLMGIKDVTGGYVQKYVDLLPLIYNEVSTFDHDIVHSSITFTSIQASSPLASFYADYSCDISKLSSNDIFVTPYILYYFHNHIKDNVLTLPVTPPHTDLTIHLNIIGVIDEQISNGNNFSIICSNDELFQTIQDMCGQNTSFHFYDFSDNFVHNVDNYTDFLKKMNSSDFSVDVTITSKAPIKESSSIYSGDVAIAAFNIFFAVLCIVSTLKLKFTNEVADYKKLFNLGLSPFYRFFTPLIDLSIIFIPSYFSAFIASVFLFYQLAPKAAETYQSRVITNYFQYSSDLLISTLILFFGCVIIISSIMIMFCIVRNPKTYDSYVKHSSTIYTSSRSHLIPYTFLTFWRNKKYNLFFIFILCFPLFVSSMYGTAAVNLVSNGNDLYADAAYIISRNQVSYGNPITDRIVKDIQQLPGVESIHMIHKTNTLYTFASNDITTHAQIIELNDYTEEQFSKYLIAGDLKDVKSNHNAIAVVDNHTHLSVGDPLILQETNQEFTVAAILKDVPLEYRSLMYLADISLIESLGQADILPADIHIYINDSISSTDYIYLNNTIPALVYDPHATYFNQKDEIASLDVNGSVTYKVATSMNILICIISILSTFLFHTQKQINRAREYDVLYKLGYSHKQIRSLIFTESFILIGIGLLIFGLLYGSYVNSIIQSIQDTQAYQYSGFALAWREIISISLGIIGVISISNIISYRRR
ncbi:MAG: FtsX-like permease family protein [Tyzzerella sp.]|nr:FtsX-like permease family protein [Tyzzerella sp.]